MVVAFDRRQRGQRSGMGQLVDIEDLAVLFEQKMAEPTAPVTITRMRTSYLPKTNDTGRSDSVG